MITIRTILLSILFCLFSALSAQNKSGNNTIGNIEKRGSWYEIHNEQSKKQKLFRLTLAN